MLDKYRVMMVPSLFFFTIVGLGIFSGVYTFSGIGLLIDNENTALILAIVIQLTIATTVLSFPFISGIFSRMVVLIIYVVFLLISTGTAYIYIYNQQEGATSIADHDIKFISVSSNYVTKLDYGYKQLVNVKEKNVLEAKRLMNEESTRGGRSGKGSGKGPEYYKKEDIYNELNIEYIQEKNKYEIFSKKLENIQVMLKNKSSSQNYASVISEIEALNNISIYKDESSQKKFKTYIESLKSPVEKAINPLLEGNYKSIGLISSIVWSSLFDLASFVIGFIWINRTRRKQEPLVDRIVNFFRTLHHGWIRIKNIKGEIGANHVITHEGEEHQLDISRLFKFGARLVALSNAVSHENGGTHKSSLDPLKLVVSHLKVLNFSSKIEGNEIKDNITIGKVGILESDISNNKMLEPIIAIMHLEELFIINHEYKAYELNRENELALDMVIYLLNNPFIMDNASLKEHYPRLVAQRYNSKLIEE